MDDARRVFGFFGDAVQKIVKRDKKPKDLIKDIQTFLSTIEAQGNAMSPTNALNTPNNNNNNNPNSATNAASISASTTSSPNLVPITSPTNPVPILPSSSSANSTTTSTPTLTSNVSPSNAPSSIVPSLITPGSTRDESKSLSLASNSITSELEQIIYMIYGDNSGDSNHKEPDAKVAKEIIDLLVEADLLHRLLQNLKYLEFEGRKYFTRIFEYSMTNRRDITVDYIENRHQILNLLIGAYEEKDVSVALSCDSILRSIIMCEDLTETILNITPSLVEPFFRYIELPNFDINSHAFSTFKLLLTEHKELAANYLRENYDSFFLQFNKLLLSDNFLCKVQCFNFLGEILTNRPNHDVMMKYVNDVNNLKLAMISLRGPKAIQLAVFQVLKVFIPNPYKADPIIKVLTQNRTNFINFLTEFERDSKDEMLIAHKQEMLDSLQELGTENNANAEQVVPPAQ